MKNSGALGDVAGQGLDAAIAAFVAQVDFARYSSARLATQTSRSSYKRVRELAPPRAGRQGHGQMASHIRWRPIGKEASVGLALQDLNAAAPHWIIQEIGTGQKAVQHVGTRANPTGRPEKGATYVKTVRSQVGRRISPGLVWSSSGTHYTPSNYVFKHTQNLWLRSQVKGAPVYFNAKTRRTAPGIRIGREIEGQHFIQKGGQAGFREYRQSVLTAARSQLRKRP